MASTFGRSSMGHLLREGRVVVENGLGCTGHACARGIWAGLSPHHWRKSCGRTASRPIPARENVQHSRPARGRWGGGQDALKLVNCNARRPCRSTKTGCFSPLTVASMLARKCSHVHEFGVGRLMTYTTSVQLPLSALLAFPAFCSSLPPSRTLPLSPP